MTDEPTKPVPIDCPFHGCKLVEDNNGYWSHSKAEEGCFLYYITLEDDDDIDAWNTRHSPDNAELLAEVKSAFHNIIWEPKSLVWQEILRSNKDIARKMIDKIEQAASVK